MSNKKQISILKNLCDDDIIDIVKNRHTIAKVIDCYDGDTCTIVFLLGDVPIKLKIRLLDIDTAEKPRRKDKSDRNRYEIKLSEAALELLKSKILNQCVYIEIEKWDKYGGRVLGYIYLIDKKGNKSGESINQQMIDSKLAVPYDGGKKETDWKKLYREWKKIN